MKVKLKLAFSTLPCTGWSIDKVIRHCLLYGYEGIELRMGEGAGVSDNMTEEEMRSASRKLMTSGITVTDIASSVCVKGVSEEEMDRAGRELEAAFRRAEIFQAEGIRIFLGNFTPRLEDAREILNEQKITAFLKEYCGKAQEKGLQLWIETHNEYAAGKRLRTLLDRVDQDNCKAIWDVIHPLEDGEAPDETMKWLGKDCVHIHIKDGRPYGDTQHHDWKYTLIGAGAVPIGHITELLSSAGYDGYYSLEWESVWRAELKAPGGEMESVLHDYAEYMRSIVNGKEGGEM